MIVKQKARRRGVVTIIVLVLLFIMVVFAAATGYSVARLRREVKLVEKQQLQRLAAHSKAQP